VLRKLARNILTAALWEKSPGSIVAFVGCVKQAAHPAGRCRAASGKPGYPAGIVILFAD
jgi:hypothetical protein